jgi:hypothetical protein
MAKEDIMRAIVDPKYRAELMTSTGITEEELKQHMEKLVDNTHPSMAVI